MTHKPASSAELPVGHSSTLSFHPHVLLTNVDCCCHPLIDGGSWHTNAVCKQSNLFYEQFLQVWVCKKLNYISTHTGQQTSQYEQVFVVKPSLSGQLPDISVYFCILCTDPDLFFTLTCYMSLQIFISSIVFTLFFFFFLILSCNYLLFTELVLSRPELL